MAPYGRGLMPYSSCGSMALWLKLKCEVYSDAFDRTTLTSHWCFVMFLTKTHRQPLGPIAYGYLWLWINAL